MVKPLELRFRYHFQGDRQTNRIDKVSYTTSPTTPRLLIAPQPEWFFNHVLTLIEDYIPFLSENIQPILDSRMSGVSRDAVHEFISAVLPMLRKKIQMLLPQIVEHAQALSHFIHEMIKFDIVLRDEFLYAPYGVEDETQWRGLTHEVLVKDDWFRHWLKVEKDCKLTPEMHIMHSLLILVMG